MTVYLFLFGFFSHRYDCISSSKADLLNIRSFLSIYDSYRFLCMYGRKERDNPFGLSITATDFCVYVSPYLLIHPVLSLFFIGTLCVWIPSLFLGCKLVPLYLKKILCVCVCVCKTVNNLQQKHIIRIFFFSPGIKSQQYLRGEDLEQEEAGPQAASGGGSGVEKGRLKSFLHLRPWLCDSSRPHGLQPTRLLLPWDFPGESTGVGCHCLALGEPLICWREKGR